MLLSHFIWLVLSGHAIERPKSLLIFRQQKLGVLNGEFSAVLEFVQAVLIGLWKAAGMLILNTLHLQIVGKYSCRNCVQMKPGWREVRMCLKATAIAEEGRYL